MESTLSRTKACLAGLKYKTYFFSSDCLGPLKANFWLLSVYVRSYEDVLPGVDGLRRAELGAEADERAGLWLSREGGQHGGERKEKVMRGRTLDSGKDLVDCLAAQAVAEDDGVLARLGWVDQPSHGEGRVRGLGERGIESAVWTGGRWCIQEEVAKIRMQTELSRCCRGDGLFGGGGSVVVVEGEEASLENWGSRQGGRSFLAEGCTWSSKPSEALSSRDFDSLTPTLSNGRARSLTMTMVCKVGKFLFSFFPTVASLWFTEHGAEVVIVYYWRGGKLQEDALTIRIQKEGSIVGANRRTGWL